MIGVYQLSKPLGFLSTGLVAVILTGCANLMPGVNVPIPDENPQQAFLQKPKFFEGDTYTFRDQITGKSSSYTVDRVDVASVTWRVGKNFRFVTSTEPVLPWLQVETDTVKVNRKLNQGSVFPLRSGQRDKRLQVTTHIEQTGNSTLDYREEFRCDVGVLETVTTIAGPYIALPIQCTRYVSGNFSPVGFVHYRAGKTVTWFAPDLGHFVRHVEMDKRFNVTKDMQLANHRASLASLTKSQQERLNRDLQKFLMTAPQASMKDWKFESVNLSVAAKMDASGLPKRAGCRTYSLTVDRSGSPRLLHRQICS